MIGLWWLRFHEGRHHVLSGVVLAFSYGFPCCMARSLSRKAKRTDVTPERPHGLSYSLTLHNEKHERILGFDNAHPVPANRGPSGKQHKFHDHRHKYEKTRIYKFEETSKIISDFYAAVDQIMKERGVKI